MTDNERLTSSTSGCAALLVFSKVVIMVRKANSEQATKVSPVETW